MLGRCVTPVVEPIGMIEISCYAETGYTTEGGVRRKTDTTLRKVK
jgi:hypothetical protein